MTRQARATAELIAGYLLALGVATLCSSVPSSLLTEGLSRVLTCCACVGWSYLIRQRVLSARLRRLLQADALLLASLCMLQTVKYDFTTQSTTANRLLWYAFYGPLTWVPLLSLFSALEVGASELERPLRRHAWLVVPAALLTCAFLANDAHQLAFSFSGPRALWDDANATHGPLYLVEVAWIGTLLVSAFVVATVRSGRLASLRSAAVALLPLALGGTYLVAYTLNGSTPPRVGPVRGPQFQEVFCLTLIAFWEALVRVGAIPSNSGYTRLFQAASFPAFIADETGAVRFRTAARMQANAQQRAAAAGGPVPTGPHTLLHAMTIPGGSVYWESDLTQVHEARGRLREARQQLAERNERLAEQNALAEERSRNEAKARLYEQAYAQLDGELDALSALVAQARETGSRRDSEAVLLEGTYVKRRANLGIVAEQLGQVPVDELVLALRETLSALESCGTSGEVQAGSGGVLPSAWALAAYEAFGQVAQAMWESGAPACSVFVAARQELLVRVSAEGLECGPALARAGELVAETGGTLLATADEGVTYVSLFWGAGAR